MHVKQERNTSATKIVEHGFSEYLGYLSDRIFRISCFNSSINYICELASTVRSAARPTPRVRWSSRAARADSPQCGTAKGSASRSSPATGTRALLCLKKGIAAWAGGHLARVWAYLAVGISALLPVSGDVWNLVADTPSPHPCPAQQRPENRPKISILSERSPPRFDLYEVSRGGQQPRLIQTAMDLGSKRCNYLSFFLPGFVASNLDFPQRTNASFLPVPRRWTRLGAGFCSASDQICRMKTSRRGLVQALDTQVWGLGGGPHLNPSAIPPLNHAIPQQGPRWGLRGVRVPHGGHQAAHHREPRRHRAPQPGP